MRLAPFFKYRFPGKAEIMRLSREERATIESEVEKHEAT